MFIIASKNLFHARFVASHRGEIEKTISRCFGKTATHGNGERPRRAILVATQMVEQSLDVDFDFLLTQIAPIDLLLQRSGRLWRHVEHEPDRPSGISGPSLDILLPARDSLAFDASEKVYARAILLRTFTALHRQTTIKLPQ